MEAFARGHSQPLDLSSPDSFRADLLDTSKAQIIMLGETHGMTVNNDLDLALLAWLYRTAGVRVYLAEFSHSTAFLIERYFDTGDERLLDLFFSASPGTQIWNREYRDFFVRFRKWNIRFPKADRVRFVGLDIEHNPNLGVWALGEWVRASQTAGRKAGAEIAGVADRLSAIGTAIRSKEATALAREAPGDVTSHTAAWSSLLGPLFPDFEIVVANMRERERAYAGEQSGKFNQIRDHAMYETFLKLYPTFRAARCYGRWGTSHIAQAPVEGTRWIATYLNQPDSPVSGKILSIWPFYENSVRLARAGDGKFREQNTSDASPPPGLSSFAAPITLVKVDAAGSPLAAYPFKGRSLGEVVQYAVVIRGATAAHPLEDSAMFAPPATGSPEAAAPVVIRTVPESGSRNVPAGEMDLVVTFSQPMAPNSYSFVTASEGQMPPGEGRPQFDADRRSCTMRVKLAPGVKYALWINRGRYQNFVGRNGTPATPYLLVFETSK